MKKNLRTSLLVILCCIFAVSVACLAGCKTKEEPPAKPTVGTIQGTTLDVEGEPLSDATVYYSEEDYVESDEDGNFEIKNVTVGEITLTVSLNGYAETVKNLTADSFDNKGVAKTQIVMEEGKGTVKGVVTMADHSEVKLAGVTVRITSTMTTTTNERGEYELTDVPMLDRKSVSASLAGYETVSKSVTKNQYSKGIAKINFELTELDLEALPGMKPYNLKREAIDPAKTIIKSGEIDDYFDISRDSIQDSSKTETHGEGFCINASTVDVRDNMVAFISTRVAVDENHKYVTAYARMFKNQNGENINGKTTYAKLGMYVFDDQGNFINDNRFGEFTEVNTESFKPIIFDLSSLNGKTVTIVLGVNTGFHCCLDRVEFTAKQPVNLTVTGVDGLEILPLYDKVTDKSFDAAALKDKWHVGGATGIVEEGIQLNGTDPWRAEDYNSAAPQPVNSYMYMTTNIDAATSKLKVSVTIVDLNATLDGAQDNKQFLPYVSVILIDKDGNKLTQTDWVKIEVAENMAIVSLEYDFAEFAGEDITVVIASNVGYRATVTGVEFAAPEQQAPDQGQEQTPDQGQEQTPDQGQEQA